VLITGNVNHNKRRFDRILWLILNFLGQKILLDSVFCEFLRIFVCSVNNILKYFQFVVNKIYNILNYIEYYFTRNIPVTRV